MLLRNRQLGGTELYTVQGGRPSQLHTLRYCFRNALAKLHERNKLCENDFLFFDLLKDGNSYAALQGCLPVC